MGRPRLISSDKKQMISLRIDPVMLHSLGILYKIDKTIGHSDAESFSVYLRNLVYKEVEKRRLQIDKYNEIVRNSNIEMAKEV